MEGGCLPCLDIPDLKKNALMFVITNTYNKYFYQKFDYEKKKILTY